MITAVLLAVSFLNYFEARNEIANYIIDPPSGNEKVTCERPGLTVAEKCPACNGSGELKLVEPNFGQLDGRIGGPKAKKVPCQLCRGKGRREAFVDPSSLALQVGRDREAFALAHQSKGEIPVGLAFVPKAKFEGADKKLLKLVEKTYGKPCKCNWTGLVACRKCSGRGYVKCSNTACKGGWDVDTRTETTVIGGRSESHGCSNSGMRTVGRSRSKTRKETKTSVTICPTCGGANMLVCPECAGKKAAVCKGCGGIGYKQPR